jgi:hypothetical protein
MRLRRIAYLLFDDDLAGMGAAVLVRWYEIIAWTAYIQRLVEIDFER